LCDASDRSQWFAARVLALMSASHLDAKTRERLTAGEKGLDGRVLARRFAVEHGDRVKAEVLAKVAPVRPAETAPSTKPDVESAQPAAP
jgi:hypothetical protein